MAQGTKQSWHGTVAPSLQRMGCHCTWCGNWSDLYSMCCPVRLQRSPYELHLMSGSGILSQGGTQGTTPPAGSIGKGKHIDGC